LRYQSAAEVCADLKRVNRDTESSGVPTLPPPHAPVRWRSRLLIATVSFALLLLLAALTPHSWRERLWGGFSSSRIRSVAVLPFVNVGADSNIEYLADGVTDGIIASLSRIPDLRVMARSTVFTYKGREVVPQKIGKDLNVDAVLLGRIEQRGDTLTVRTDLVSAKDGSELWGGQYNRKVADLLSIQEAISKEIYDNVRPKLTAQEAPQLTRHYTNNPEAYQLYLRGVYYRNKWTEAGFTKAIDYFKQAQERDPNYALAYAGLADAYNFLGDSGYVAPKEIRESAKSAAEQALKIDPMLPEAHVSQALVREDYEWDWAGAESEFKRALELDPNSAAAHQWYGHLLLRLGRMEEARTEFKAAQQIDPLSLTVNTGVALQLYFERQYEAAIEHLKKTLNLDPNFVPAQQALEAAYAQSGMFREAIAEQQTVLTLSGNPDLAAAIGEDYRKSGYTGVLRSWLAGLNEVSKQRYVSPYNIAQIHARLQDKQQALTSLEEALNQRDCQLSDVKVDPVFDDIRTDARFQQVVLRLGMP
jgi:TolB-like protein/Tfp pilus assembly protein PilF